MYRHKQAVCIAGATAYVIGIVVLLCVPALTPPDDAMVTAGIVGTLICGVGIELIMVGITMYHFDACDENMKHNDMVINSGNNQPK